MESKFINVLSEYRCLARIEVVVRDAVEMSQDPFSHPKLEQLVRSVHHHIKSISLLFQ